MINYLLGADLITQEEFTALQRSGYYPEYGYYEQYVSSNDHSDFLEKERYGEENLQEETILKLERKLEKKERKKAKGQYKSNKTKRKIRSGHKKNDLKHLLKLGDLWWHPPERIRITDKMCSRVPGLKRFGSQVFSRTALFWDNVFLISSPKHGVMDSGSIPEILRKHRKHGTRKEWRENFLGNCESIMMLIQEKNYKLKSKKYITPHAYCKLIQSSKINANGWSLTFKLQKNTFIRLTNKDGALIPLRQKI